MLNLRRKILNSNIEEHMEDAKYYDKEKSQIRLYEGGYGSHLEK